MQSQIQPAKSNGYIYWEKGQANSYLLKIYQNTNNSLTLLQTDTISSNYYHFNAPQLLSTDLFYTITAMDRDFVILEASDPAAINPNSPPPSANCFRDCNGKKESYRIYQMLSPTGQPYLMASDDAGADPNTGLITPYYQAIDINTYNNFYFEHPYVRITGYNQNTNKPIYYRDHIKINQNTPGIPFYDAANNGVTNGWFVEKKMDKYAHFNNANTGMYEGMDSWCTSPIQNASVNFNQHVVPSTLMPVSSEQQSWFLAQTGTNSDGSPIYYIPTGLECIQTNISDTTEDTLNDPEHRFTEYYYHMKKCWEQSASNSFDPFDCLVEHIVDGVGGDVISGTTFESMDAAVGYFFSIENDNGVGKRKYQTGDFAPGLYKVVTFLENGSIVPTYLELGTVLDIKDAHIDIYPNTIVGRTLKFDLRTDMDAEIDIIVQKLDGTTVYTESTTLIGGNTIHREINVTGDIPYNQLRVSITLPSGTIVQSTALVE